MGGRRGDGAADRMAGHSEVDNGAVAAGGDLVHLGEFLIGGGKADLQALGFASPAFALGFADAGGQVVADLGQPWLLGGVGPQQRAADVPLTELTDARIGYRYGSTDCDRRASSTLSES